MSGAKDWGFRLLSVQVSLIQNSPAANFTDKYFSKDGWETHLCDGLAYYSSANENNNVCI